MIEIINSTYSLFGISATANEGDIAGIALVLLFTILSIGVVISATRKQDETPATEAKGETPVAPVAEEKAAPVVEEPKIAWSERLRKGLSRSRSEVWGKIGDIFSRGGLNEDTLEEIEEILYGADIGPTMVQELIEVLEERAKESDLDGQQVKEVLFNFLKGKMAANQQKVDSAIFDYEKESHQGTKVIMVVGVNGAGKTTTIGKLATKLSNQGANVVVGACDTFRAAAVDQLEVWCKRAGAEMVRAKEGTNPTGVAYDTLQTAINSKADYCILDTAGRLHTKGNLMDELSRGKTVLQKLDESAPHETLLVLDAITGQNAMRQAEEFNKALGLTGLIFTKCDGSSKVGSAISIVNALEVPITYIGVGESVEDLNKFELDEYLKALLDM